MAKLVKEKIILGLDPGTNVMGYGLVLVRGQEVTLLQYGVLHLTKYGKQEVRLKRSSKEYWQSSRNSIPTR